MTTAAPARDYELGPHWDEAFDRAGVPRGRYGDLLEAIEDAGTERLARELQGWVARRGLTFGDDEPIPADPVPRLVAHDEWIELTAALEQRTRALNDFIADVYGDRRIVSAGIISADAIATADHFDPAMAGIELAVPHAPVVGFDIVRAADGRLLVLEDNLRTPSGIVYATELRRAMQRVLPGFAGLRPIGLEGCFEPLGAVLSAAAEARGSGLVVILTDGPSNSAWYEHRAIARRLGVALVTPERLRLHDGSLCVATAGGALREIGVVYRRTDEDRLRAPDGTPTWLGEMLLEPLRNGRLTVVNAPGTGVADDKLIHAHVEDMIRFYLGQEPLIESVRTFDLTHPHELTRALGRLPNLVVKPRTGHGGQGVFIGSLATRAEREGVAATVRAEPGCWVAQETVLLSRHPTISGATLEPRHVDLRVFAVAGPAGVTVLPAALTRMAPDSGSFIVNSSQGGGAKDTWILDSTC